MGLIQTVKDWFIRKGDIMYLPYRLGQKGAIWLDIQPSKLYDEIPQYKTVIDRGASMFSNADVILVDEAGNPVNDQSFKDFINSPNAIQSINEFLKELWIQYRVLGNQFQYINKPSKLNKWPVAMWNVSPMYMKPVLTGKVFDQVEFNGIVSGFEYESESEKRKFETESIIWFRVTDINNPIIGRSPVYSLKFPLTNTKLAYEFRNVIMNEKGPLGIFSPVNNKDGMGGIPLTDTERIKVSQRLTNTYGIQDGKGRFMVENLSFTPITYPTRDHMLFEEIEANQLAIIDMEGLNANIFANKTATFENVKNGMIASYQDCIIPFADLVAQIWTKKLCGPGQKIRFSYDHIQILKQDTTSDVNNFSKQVNDINQLVTSGLLTADQGKKIINNLMERYNVPNK